METMRSLGLVGNGQNSTLGDMQPERIQRMIEILGPIFRCTEQADQARPDT